MVKIKDNVDLKEIEKLGFVKINNWEITRYEKTYGKIIYVVSSNRVIHKLKDIGYFTEEYNMTEQDIKRLRIADLVEKVD